VGEGRGGGLIAFSGKGLDVGGTVEVPQNRSENEVQV